MFQSMRLPLRRNTTHPHFPCCLCSALGTSLCSAIGPAGFLCVCSKASPPAVHARHRTWLYQEMFSCEHLGLLIQHVREEEGESAEIVSKKKSLHGIFGGISLSPRKLDFCFLSLK